MRPPHLDRRPRGADAASGRSEAGRRPPRGAGEVGLRAVCSTNRRPTPIEIPIPIEAIKGGTQPGSNFASYAAPMTEMILLGCLATRMGQTLELNPDTGAITNVQAPSEWVMPTYRAGWSL